MTDLRLGALCWNQYTDWPSLLGAGVRAETLGYDSLWTWDHLYPIVGNSDGPIHEGWLPLAAWAQLRTRIGTGWRAAPKRFANQDCPLRVARPSTHIPTARHTP